MSAEKRKRGVEPVNEKTKTVLLVIVGVVILLAAVLSQVVGL